MSDEGERLRFDWIANVVWWGILLAVLLTLTAAFRYWRNHDLERRGCVLIGEDYTGERVYRCDGGK